MEKKNLIVKSANVLSNSVVSKVSDTLLFDSNTFLVDNEKDAKKAVTNFVKSIKESDDLANPIVFAIRAKEKADLEYQKQISQHICKVFGADIVVTNIISEVSKMSDNEFFTPEYLDKLGIYKIPNGLILDTVQKCRSFVSSLYATALSEHKKEIRDGGGVEMYLARAKEIISFNDSQFIATKFANMSIVRKYELLYSILANCTKSEKVAIWSKLGVHFKIKAKGAKVCDKEIGIIPIEPYTPTQNKVDVNFYHEYPTNAIPLSKEDAKGVMDNPVTPLATPESAKGSAKGRKTKKTANTK